MEASGLGNKPSEEVDLSFEAPGSLHPWWPDMSVWPLLLGSRNMGRSECFFEWRYGSGHDWFFVGALFPQDGVGSFDLSLFGSAQYSGWFQGLGWNQKSWRSLQLGYHSGHQHFGSQETFLEQFAGKHAAQKAAKAIGQMLWAQDQAAEG